MSSGANPVSRGGKTQLCTATAWNGVVNRNGLGGPVLVPDSDVENKFYDNSS